ncbi:unnamed protein product, partial [Musa textilis]
FSPSFGRQILWCRSNPASVRLLDLRCDAGICSLDRTNQHVNEQVRQPECDSHLAVVKVLPSRDGLLKILNSNRDIKNVTTLAMDAKLLSVHGKISLLPGMGNISEGIFPGQSKWRFCDDEVYLFTCKHPEQVD